MKRGASLYNPSIYPTISYNKERWLGSICGVTILFEQAGARHTHEDCDLDKIMVEEGIRPDLIIGDHGFAAAGIRAEIPTIAIVDTNDTEIIVASCLYPDRVFPIPMHDNAGIEPSMAMAYYFEYLINKMS